MVDKANRRLVGAICLLLATKVNEPKGFKVGPLLNVCSMLLYLGNEINFFISLYSKRYTDGLQIFYSLQVLSKTFGIPAKEIREHEFSLFAALEFNLYLPLHEIVPHFERIFTTLGSS
jgi:hypothetical protein